MSKHNNLLAVGRLTPEDRVRMTEQSPSFQRLVKAVELKSLRAAKNNEQRMQSAVVPTNAPLATIDFFNLARGTASGGKS